MVNSECQEMFVRLSGYVDGEGEDRQSVESHLATCRACQLRVADLRAQSKWVKSTLEAAGSEVDFSQFKEQVMARVPWRRPSKLRRLWAARTPLQKGLLAGALAACAAAVIAILPFFHSAADGYASPEVAVRMVSTNADAKVAPLVIKAENGDAIIWLVQHPNEQTPVDGTQAQPKQEPAGIKAAEPPKGGDL